METTLPFLLALTTSISKPYNKTYAHLQDPIIREICSVRERSLICASNNTNVCTARRLNGRMEFRDYGNHCYLFLSNMCEYPGNEFHIASSGSCVEYANSAVRTNHEDVARRQNSNETQLADETEATEAVEAEAAAETEAPDAEETLVEGYTAATEAADDGELETTTVGGDQEYADGKPVERLRLVTASQRYKVTEAYDGHPCPGYCPELYQPVCLIANRGFGMYFKYLTFLNHCQADMYYCGHSEEFAPPPDESEEMISGSKLDWSFCASYRFLQFARFSEVASSMGHYGWLLGDHKYSHILNPAQKIRLSGVPRHVVGR